MARRPKKKALNTAEKYASYLLYEITSGNMGEKPEHEIKNNSATFGEKRGLLDSLIKIASLERESEENEEAPSGFDTIRRDIARRAKYDSGETWGTGNNGGAAESNPDDAPAGETSSSEG